MAQGEVQKGLEIYKGKRVLVTGHTGFKGGWLTIWLDRLGTELIGHSLLPPTAPSFFEAVGLKGRINHLVGDVRDFGHLLSVMKEFQPEIIFHLAAQPLVRLSYKEPRLTYETNVMGVVNILEAIRQTESVRVGVIITTDKCYENREWIYGYRENDPMGGYDPYSSSKGCAELVVSAYIRSFFNPEDYGRHKVSIASVRAGNVIGGGDWAEDRLISDCVRALSAGETIIIRNPDAVRPWQYILEPTSGYLWLGAVMCQDGAKFTGGWNFGPDDKDIIPVKEMVELAIRFWGGGNYEIDPSEGQPHEAKLLKLDCSKVHWFLKWYPAYNVHQAMEETIKWYKAFYMDATSEDLYELSINQIDKYIREAQKQNILWAKRYRED